MLQLVTYPPLIGQPMFSPSRFQIVAQSGRRSPVQLKGGCVDILSRCLHSVSLLIRNVDIFFRMFNLCTLITFRMLTIYMQITFCVQRCMQYPYGCSIMLLSNRIHCLCSLATPTREIVWSLEQSTYSSIWPQPFLVFSTLRPQPMVQQNIGGKINHNSSSLF